MRTLVTRGAPLVLLLFLMGTPARSIVIRHDREDSRYQKLGERYRGVCDMRLPGGAGTLIGPRWVLTAAHVVRHFPEGHSVKCGAEAYLVERVVPHPEGREGQHDVALVRLARPVMGVVPIRLYRDRDEVGKVVVFVGRGQFGNGRAGIQRRDGLLRGATNRVERIAGGSGGMLVFNFDQPPSGTDLEGISGPGDSGGPAFLEKKGVLGLAGVSSWQDNQKQAGREGVYGVLEFYTRVSAYADWIDRTIGAPEP